MTVDAARRHAREVAELNDELAVRLRVLDESGANVAIHAEARGIGPDADIETLTILVLMEAARSAQEDLKAILASVKAINTGRRQVAHELGRAGSGHDGKGGATPPAQEADVDAIIAAVLTAYGTGVVRDGRQLMDDMDAVDELGDAEQLRLQTMMDRMSRMMSTLSNILKKISDTNQQLVSNLK